MIRWRTLSWALVLGACAVPDLDTTGAIRCGAEGACPEGFQCRIGRCCPAGAAPNACPTIPAGTAGAPCTGTSCTVNLGARTVAGTCVSNFPGGYCTVSGCDLNNSDGTCGESAACITSASATVCIRRCVFDPARPQPQPCRNLGAEAPATGETPYVCIKNPFDRTTTAGLCVPDCTRVAWCGMNTMCDATTRSCVPVDCRRAANVCEPMGQSCNTSSGQCFRCSDQRTPADCMRSGQPCAWVGASSVGVCRQRCSPGAACPAGSMCVGVVCNNR